MGWETKDPGLSISSTRDQSKKITKTAWLSIISYNNSSVPLQTQKMYVLFDTIVKVLLKQMQLFITLFKKHIYYFILGWA